VFRGIALAVISVVVLGSLLAAADPVFASVFRIPFDWSSAMTHGALTAVGMVVISVLLVDAANAPRDNPRPWRRPLGPIESGTVLGAVAVLYGLFATAQVVAARGGADHVLQTANLTYAEYAREGFFQLLAVAGLTLVVLVGVRAATRPPEGRAKVVLIALGLVVIALTLVIVGVAVHRLGLYEEAFGLTMLRFMATVTAWWLGAVFVLVGMAYAGVLSSRRWLGPAIVTSALVTILVLNVMNPEALVAQRNVDRAKAGGKIDVGYLVTLSDDAVPTLVAALPDLPEPERDTTRTAICRRRRDHATGTATDADRDALDFNLSAHRAAESQEQLCDE
jgi:Domain of unknown function (DUF4173)